MEFKKIVVPQDGEKITHDYKGSLIVPDKPIIPFIEGDGIGTDITPVMLRVIDHAVQKAYGDKKKIIWMEVYCGEKSLDCLLYTSPSPRDGTSSRMPSSA